MNKFLLLILMLWSVVMGKQLFVSTTGSDSGVTYAQNDIDHPWLNPQMALDSVQKGDTINLRSGVYTNPPTNRFLIPEGKNGTSWSAGSYYTVRSYPGDWGILDGQNDVNTGTYPSVLGVTGASTARNFWKFDSIEIRNGTITDGTCGRGFYVDVGPFWFRNCYIHDNLGSQNGTLPFGIGGHTWNHSTVELCLFKDNGSIVDPSRNAPHIMLLGDYRDSILILGISSLSDTTGKQIKNDIRYNAFLGGGTGIFLAKGNQFLTGHSTRAPFSMLLSEYGDKIHHNYFEDLLSGGIDVCSDFAQIYNNVFSNCNGTAIKVGHEGTQYKTCIYNNTFKNKNILPVHLKNYHSDTWVANEWTDIDNDFHAYVANNLFDSVPRYSINTFEEVTLDKTIWSAGTFDSVVIGRNYFYSPSSTGAASPTSPFYVSGSKYTISTIQSLYPGIRNFLKTAMSGGQLWAGYNWTAKIMPLQAHAVSGDTTIANGGTGGDHWYLSGVQLPSYIGAVPSDTSEWHNVLSLRYLDPLFTGEVEYPYIDTAGGSYIYKYKKTDRKTISIPVKVKSSSVARKFYLQRAGAIFDSSAVLQPGDSTNINIVGTCSPCRLLGVEQSFALRVTDDFNSYDAGDTLFNSNWMKPLVGATGYLYLSDSGAVTLNNNNTACIALWRPNFFGASQIARVIVDTVYSTTGRSIRLYIHSDSTYSNYYAFIAYRDSCIILRGATIIAHNTNPTNLSIGDSLKFFSYGDSLFAVKNTTTLISVFDTTYRTPNTTRVGIGLLKTSNPAWRIDNFYGGDYIAEVDTDTTIITFCATPIIDSVMSTKKDTVYSGQVATLYGDEFKSTGGVVLIGGVSQEITQQTDDSVKINISVLDSGAYELIYTDSCSNDTTKSIVVLRENIRVDSVGIYRGVLFKGYFPYDIDSAKIEGMDGTDLIQSGDSIVEFTPPFALMWQKIAFEVDLYSNGIAYRVDLYFDKNRRTTRNNRIGVSVGTGL